VHYRQAPDPVAARAALLVAPQPVATDGGLCLVEGKMVLELVPPDRPLKGGAVERLAGEHALQAVLYAGTITLISTRSRRSIDWLERGLRR
jgi:trehalose-6-phosphatase